MGWFDFFGINEEEETNKDWRFPTSKVTSEDIATYRKEIKEIGEETKEETQKLTAYAVTSELCIYTFTDENHPAHPSVVKRCFRESNKHVYMDMQGHYAGSRDCYDQLWKMFIESDKQMVKNLRGQNRQ